MVVVVIMGVIVMAAARPRGRCHRGISEQRHRGGGEGPKSVVVVVAVVGVVVVKLLQDLSTQQGQPRSETGLVAWLLSSAATARTTKHLPQSGYSRFGSSK